MENTTQLRRSPEMNIRMDIKFDTKVTLILIFSVDSKSDWGVGIRNLSKRALALRNLGPCCLIGNLILSEKSSNLLSGKSILSGEKKDLVCGLGEGYCWLFHANFEEDPWVSEAGTAHLHHWLYLLSHFPCLSWLVINELSHCSDMAPCACLCLRRNLHKYMSAESSVLSGGGAKYGWNSWISWTSHSTDSWIHREFFHFNFFLSSNLLNLHSKIQKPVLRCIRCELTSFGTNAFLSWNTIPFMTSDGSWKSIKPVDG